VDDLEVTIEVIGCVIEVCGGGEMSGWWMAEI
jgi:hypothetical protein